MSNEGLSDTLLFSANGVLQGGTLASFMFIIALIYAMRRVLDKQFPREIQEWTIGFRPARWEGPTQSGSLADVDFADDIGVTA
jgi:hypothetical protein